MSPGDLNALIARLTDAVAILRASADPFDAAPRARIIQIRAEMMARQAGRAPQ